MTPVSQILLQPRRAPGPHLPGKPGRAIPGSSCACPVLAHCTSDSYLLPAPLGRGDWRREWLRFTLTQLLGEGASVHALHCFVLFFFQWRWGERGRRRG